MSLPLLHAGGIGWDEVLVSLVIVVAVGLVAVWLDRGRDDEPGRPPGESLTGPERERDT